MMGHSISTYHDVQMKGVEFLRGIYAASGMSIKPKTKSSQIETLEGIVRASGLDPDKILTKEALTEPHRTLVIGSKDTEQLQLNWLLRALKQKLKQELTEATMLP